MFRAHVLNIKLVNYWAKYTEMHGQQNVKINYSIFSSVHQTFYRNLYKTTNNPLSTNYISFTETNPVYI